MKKNGLAPIALLLMIMAAGVVVFGGVYLYYSNKPTAVTTGNTVGSHPTETLAIITQSGSSNGSGYTITIHTDGSADATIDRSGATTDVPAGTIDAARLGRLLAQIGDVSTLIIEPCAKSASFGTTTKISYHGKTSGDIQCASGIGNTLAKVVDDIETKMKLSPAPYYPPAQK